MRPVVKIDAAVDLQAVDDRLLAALERIAPFGMGNPRPFFAARGATLNGRPQLWKEKHLKLALKQSGRSFVMKGFGLAERIGELENCGPIDIAFEIERDWFGGIGMLARNWTTSAAVAAVA